MKHCRACDVDVATPAVLCPLCGTPLAGLADADCAAVYPPAGSRKEYNFVKRLLLLLSVVGAAVCIVVNLLVMPSFWWWTIVVTALVYAWAVGPHAMRRGGNAAGKVLMQVVAGSALAVLVTLKQATGAGRSASWCPRSSAQHRGGGGAVMRNRTNWAVCVSRRCWRCLGWQCPCCTSPGWRTAGGAVVPSILRVATLAGMAVFARPDQKRIPPAAAF
ncbi:MAG: DUF6320 domain-containing protein [Ruthenibacterium lactatiformans]